MCAFGEWDGHRAIWTALGLVIAGAIGLALFRYVGTLLFAIFLYYAIRPVHRRIDRFIDHPSLTATVTILLLVIPMVTVVCYTILVAFQELDRVLAASNLEAYRSAFDPYLSLARQGNLDRLRDSITGDTRSSVASAFRQGLPEALNQLSSIVGSILGILARFFLMLTFLFYLLRDDQKLRRWFYESVQHDEQITSFLDAVDSDLQTIFVSNLAIVGVAAAIAAGTYIGLNLVAPGGQVVATPVLLALLIGIGTLIPAVGMKLVYLPYGLYLLFLALTTSVPLWQPIAFLILSFVIIDTVPDFFARSLLSARSGVHMGLILLGYFLGTLAFGWYGLFLGPIVVVLAVHFGHEIFPRLARNLLSK